MIEFQLAGCVPFDRQEGPGFFLPVFTSPGEKGIFIQEVSPDGDMITGFIKLASSDGQFLSVHVNLSSRVGDQPIFVFMNRAGKSICGRLDTIGNELKEIAPEAASPGVALQIADLVGSRAERRSARSEAFNHVAARFGGSLANRSLTNSVVIQCVWDTLAAAANDQEALLELSRLRRLIALSVNLGLPEVFPDGIWEHVSGLVSINRESLRAQLDEELPDDGSSATVGTQLQMDLDEPNASELEKGLRRVGRATRQEERIAIVMEQLLSNPPVGHYLLRTHTDKSELARLAIKTMLDNLPTLDEPGPNEQFLAKLAGWLFKNAFPMGRGELLLYLARHLGKYPSIADAIRTITDQSSSYYVARWRDEIYDELELP